MGLGRTLLRALEVYIYTPDVLVVDKLPGRPDVDAVRPATGAAGGGGGDRRRGLAVAAVQWEAMRGAVDGVAAVTLGDEAATAVAAARRRVAAASRAGGVPPLLPRDQHGCRRWWRRPTRRGSRGRRAISDTDACLFWHIPYVLYTVQYAHPQAGRRAHARELAPRWLHTRGLGSRAPGRNRRDPALGSVVGGQR